MQTFLYTIPATNTPSQITGGAMFTQARFMPFKAFTASGTPTLNTNAAFIGPKSGEQSFQLSTGNPVLVDYASSQSFYDSFTNWWVVGTAGDGVYISYL